MAGPLNWLKRAIASLRVQKTHASESRDNLFPRIYDSQLEDRRVLNAGAVVTAADLAALSFDAGSQANDGVADKFELSRSDSSQNANDIAVTINGQRVWQGSSEAIRSIQFNGSNDSDQFYIDPTIHLPAGVFLNGNNAAATSQQSQGASDFVVLAASSGTRFEEVAYRTSDNLTQVRFAVPSNQPHANITIKNVASIQDFTSTLNRTIETGSQNSTYSLQNSNNSGLLEFNGENSRLEFTAPSSRLTVNLQSAHDSHNSLWIDRLDAQAINRIHIEGGQTDSVRQTGSLQVGQSLIVATGSIHIDGAISTGLHGEIRLDATGGTLTVNGELISRGDDFSQGGRVVLTGDQVLLEGATRVDVSGGMGGGDIRVGGGYQGQDTSVRNARYTYVSNQTVLNADSRLAGNGGSVIVWSDDRSIIEGSANIFARGGLKAGNGGFIETSGKKYLKIDGAANASAFHGEAGTWLIDPNDIEIVTAAGSSANTSYVLVSTIETALATQNVSIVTNTPSAGNGDIRIVAALNLSPANARTLTLNATRDIIFQNVLAANANLQVNLIAGRDVNSSLVSIGQLSSLTIDAARNVTLGTVALAGGTLTVNIDTDNNDAGATFQSTGALTAGAIAINGSTTANDNVTIGSTATTNTGSIQFSNINNLSLQGDVTAATTVVFTSVAGQLSLGSNVDVTANNGPIDFSTITSGILLAGSNGSTNILTANGATGNLTLAPVTATNSSVSLTLSSSANASVSSINLQNGTLTANIDTDNNNVGATFQSTGALTAGAIAINGSTTANDNVTIGSTATTNTGSIQFSNINNLSLQGDIASATTVAFTSVAGQLSLGSNVDVTANNGPIDFSTITSGILLAGSNGSTNILSANGATGNLTLAPVTATNSNLSLTLSSSANASVSSINLQNGTLTANIDTDNNNVGATFQSTGALTAGVIAINGSTTANDNVTIGSTATTNTGSIQFSNINNLSLQGDIASATTVVFTSVAGQLSLGSNVDVTANNGPIDFSTITSGVLLAGSNGSTNILTANGATGNLTLAPVTATNSSVSLTLSSSANASVSNINLQNGTLTANIDTDNNNVGATFQSTGALTAGAIAINGSTTANDNVTLGSTATTNTGSIQFSNINNLSLQGDVTAPTTVVFTSVAGQLSLGSNVDVTANNGPIDFSTITSGILLAGSNGSTNILTANGATGNLTLAPVTATNSSVSLTLSSSSNTSVSSINLQNGTLTANIDTDNNNVGATFQSTAALTAGAIAINGSTTANDNVTLGSTATTNTGSIQFSNINNLSLQGDIASATTVVFTSVAGQLSLGSNVDVTANNGPIDFSTITSGVLLAGSNGSTNILTANGATGNLTLAPVTATNSSVSLTLSSSSNASVSSINLQNGTLTANIDTDNNNVGATFQSTGALTAGAIAINGSTTANDNVTLGSTATTNTGSIQFSNINNLSLQGDVTAATSVIFTSVAGQLSLGSNVDVTANNGPIDFSTITSGILLAGSNGSTNILTANGATGNLTLAPVTATNSNVSLTLASAANLLANDINIQSGDLVATFSNQDVATANVATFAGVTAKSMTVSGNSRTDDRVVIASPLVIGNGGLLVNQFTDLRINALVTSDGVITATGIAGAVTHLANNVLSKGGDIALTGGTLLIDGGAARTIASGSGGVATGGNIVLGNVDGTNGAAELTIDSRGTSTAGSVSVGAVTATDSGLNRLSIQTAAPVTSGSVTLGSTRLVGKAPGTAASLVVNSGGSAIQVNGGIDLSSNNSIDGGSIDLGTSQITPTTASSTLTLNTRNTNVAGGDGGSIRFGGVSNSGVNYFDSVSIDTSAANSAKRAGDLDFSNTANPTISVDGNTGTGISLIGTIVKAFSGVLSFLTKPTGASASSSSIDVSKADFQSTAGLRFDTSGGGTATTAGNVTLGDIGVSPANRPNTISVDTRGTTTNGKLSLDDGAGASTELHVDGTMNLANTGIELTDNALLRTYGAGNMSLGDVTTSTAVPRALTLNSQSNISVSAINLTGGALIATFDSDNNSANATFQSTGAVAAGSISISGSANRDDTVTIGSTATSTVGAIQFSDLGNLTFQGDITAATNVVFTNVSGQLSLGSNADITANNGPIDFSTIIAGILLAGSNGSTNVLTANGSSGMLVVGNVIASSPSIALTLRSTGSITVGSIDIQNGTLSGLIDTDNNNVGSQFASYGAIRAGAVTISGSTTVNDDISFGSTVTTTIGAIQVIRFDDLTISGDWVTADGVTTTGVSTSRTHLAANITSTGGNIAMADGTLLINGSNVRQIKSGGAGVNALNGGSVTLGAIDGAIATAELEIDTRGTATSGNVTLGEVTAGAGNTGLSRLRIQTDGTTLGQVSLSNIRLITKNVTPALLTVVAGGRTILADGTIDLSSSVQGQSGGSVDFGTSIVAPKSANSTLVIRTSNTNSISGADGSNGGDVLLGGLGVNSANSAYFNTVTIDLSTADILDLAGTLRFGAVANPSIQVDGVTGTGIRISGRVDNAAGKTLSMTSNPGNAAQNTSSIDVSKATFIGAGSLSFSTSGGNSALNAGNISLGDIGILIRPVSLVVDTRGSLSSGHLILDDGVAGSSTEIRIDGTIDFSNVEVDLLDDVLLETRNDGNNLLLGTTNALGAARNLQLRSDSGITVGPVNLLGGAFQANVDVNDNEAGVAFRSTGPIASGSVAVSGSAANNDIVIVGGSVTTTGAISFSNLNQLQIQAIVSAGTTFSATNIAGAVDFRGTSGIIANGAIDLLTSVNAVTLSGVAGDVTLIEAKGNAALISLASVTASNPGTRLNLRSDFSVNVRDVDMKTGTLDVLFGRSTTLTNATARLRQVTAGELIVFGTSTANDSAILDGVVDVGSNGVQIQNLANLDINANLQAVGNIVANNVRDRILVAEAVSIQSGQGINLLTNVGQIQLVGINGLTNLFQANGESSSLRLANIQALQNVALVLRSANNLQLTSIQAAGSSVLLEIDHNDNTIGSQLDAGQILARQITILGGTDLNDVANLTGLIQSSSGTVLVSSLGTVNLNGNLVSATGLEISNVAGRVNIGAGQSVKALNGDVAFGSSINEIRFLGGTGTTNEIQAINGNVSLGALTELNTSALIDVRADRNVVLRSADLNSPLRVTAGDNNSSIGTINATGTIKAGSISLVAATGIGSTSTLATSTGNISAVNRLDGHVQIANNHSGTVVVSNLVVNQGGNLLFSQAGGGNVRFQGVTTNADTTPAVNESDARLSNAGGSLVVEGAGITAGGLGNVVLETVNSGDVQLLSATRAAGGTIAIQSARQITGQGLLQSQAIDLRASTGIGLTGAVQTATTQLRATSQSNSIDLQNTSAARTTVSQLVSAGAGAVKFNQVGGGDVEFQRVATGAAPTNAGSNINLSNSNGSVLVLGEIVAGGGGSIRFDAQNNLVIGAGAVVQTQGVNATISGNAAGRFQFTPGATLRAGSSNADTEAVVTKLPPLVSVQPTVNSIGVNVDSEGFATLQIQLGGPNPILVDRNFSVVIDWGDSQIDKFPNGSISPLTINPRIARFDASGTLYSITHQYQGNPNVTDPIADIPVKVTVGVDALNRIQFSDSQGPVTSLSQVVNQSLVVPAAGLFTLRFDLPQAPTLQTRIVVSNPVVLQADNQAVPAVSSAEIVVTSGGSAVEKRRSYVLRVITPASELGEVSSSEDIELTDKDIEDLSSGKLFQKLRDNRYRIYLIREDGNELLLKDFYLRNHRPLEVDEMESAQESAPTEERVLDKDFDQSSNPSPGAISVKQETYEKSETAVGESPQLGSESQSQESPVADLSLAIGSIVPATRSLRKAARRYRAG